MTVPRAPALLRTPKRCCMLAKTAASGKLRCSDACLGGGPVWAEFARSISVPLSDLTLAQGSASVTLGSFDTFAAHCIYDRFGDLGSNCMIFAPG
jgi:hypothetical protein